MDGRVWLSGHGPRLRFCTQRLFLAGSISLGTYSPQESEMWELVGLNPGLSLCVSITCSQHKDGS